VPLAGRPDVSRLSRLGQQAGAGLRAVQVLPRDQAPPADRKLDRTACQLAIDPGKAIVTSFRRHPQKEHLEIRVFNPTSDAITETLTLTQAPRSAQSVNLEGEPADKLDCRDNKVTVKLAPRQIVTVALDVAS
jgi:alpha-mannosidase